MPETRNPQWVCCGECGHEWIGFYTPISVRSLSKIVRSACCPSCSSDAKKISIKLGDKK